MKKTIVFVSHEATLTGAPILLLNIVTWLGLQAKYDLVVVLAKDGPLRQDFEKVAKVILYNVTPSSRVVAALLRRSDTIDKYQLNRFRRVLRGKNIKLIFSNTIVNADLVKKFRDAHVPIITYVHELSFIMRMQQLYHGGIDTALSNTSFFLAGSKAVTRHLVLQGVDPNKIEVIYSSIPFEAIEAQLQTYTIEKVRAELGLPINARLLVAVGTASWRKGSDLFVQLADVVSKRRSDIHFAWVGATPNTMEYLQLVHDVERYGLVDNFHIIPTTPEYLKYLAVAEMLILPSREDTFPLVVLEAAVAGKPTVCFADAGGSPEFVGTEYGVVVPYGQIEKMADAVEELLRNDEERRDKGKRAREAVRTNYNISGVTARIEEVIEAFTA
ncbi:glycosyltransferase family 4 protein [Hymenobacter weizhouensis]|uniref:glycosyltransferase family 4 protein n=1 Tax=Hymenobacter sp. YIM 151500-1 TaxID=2987689 RepID=UPI002225D34C|nr:glycosyltransferase family 4 protein [Hymenobacter sp. YIM 151500-1]UYZ61371.1 glycosyltransferase family 4 protein [Hymenobacter sp. YIM 151500-1]